MDKQIVIRDLLISYTEHPGKGGPTLLFLHGWRSNKEVWNNVVTKILDIEYSILAIDLPGFGNSQNPHPAPLPKGEGGWTVGDYAEVVAEFIRKLDLRQVIIVGHSFGGRVGIKLSSAHPELVSKLVLVDSAGFAQNSSKKKLLALAAKIVKPIFRPRMMQGLRQKIYRGIGAEDYVATPELQKTFVNVVKEDLSTDMARIHLPTLIVCGRHDKDTPLRFGQKMYATIKNSSLVVLEHAGHFSFVDQPEKFAEVLKKFAGI